MVWQEFVTVSGSSGSTAIMVVSFCHGSSQLALFPPRKQMFLKCALIWFLFLSLYLIVLPPFRFTQVEGKATTDAPQHLTPLNIALGLNQLLFTTVHSSKPSEDHLQEKITNPSISHRAWDYLSRFMQLMWLCINMSSLPKHTCSIFFILGKVPWRPSWAQHPHFIDEELKSRVETLSREMQLHDGTHRHHQCFFPQLHCHSKLPGQFTICMNWFQLFMLECRRY